MKSIGLINFITGFLLVLVGLCLYQLYNYFSSGTTETVRIDALCGLVTGIMAIAILLQIFSSNKQLQTVLPSIQIKRACVEYQLLKGSEGDTQISKMDISLDLLNESSSPAYIKCYKLLIGEYGSRFPQNFNLQENDKTKVQDLLIPPHDLKKFHIVYPTSPHLASLIEDTNNKKLEDIHEIEIELIGNIGSKKGRIEFVPKTSH